MQEIVARLDAVLLEENVICEQISLQEGLGKLLTAREVASILGVGYVLCEDGSLC